jgi:hypothetical protein
MFNRDREQTINSEFWDYSVFENFFFYQYLGTSFKSNISFPDLPQVRQSDLQYSFQVESASAFQPLGCDWFHSFNLPDGTPWLSLAKQGSYYRLHFHKLADYLFWPQTQTICCHPEPMTPLGTIRHLLLNQVFPFVLSHQGLYILHASAVKIADGGVAFIGKSGWGKSTLAAYFRQQSHTVLTDDGLLVDTKEMPFSIIPSYSGSRLWEDSLNFLFASTKLNVRQDVHYTNKTLINPGQDTHVSSSSNSVPLQRFYVLSAPEDNQQNQAIALTLLSPRAAMAALLGSTFRLDITDHARLKAEFNWLSQLSSSVPFYSLSYPRSFSYLSAVRSAIMNSLTLGNSLSELQA